MFTTVNFHAAVRVKVSRHEQKENRCHVLAFQFIDNEENRLELTVFSDAELPVFVPETQPEAEF